jgi:GAF domain-containing protein
MSGPESTTTSSDVLALVREVTVALASEADLDVTLRLAARRLCEALELQACYLYEYGEAEELLTIVAAWEVGAGSRDDGWVGESVAVRERPSYRAGVVERRVIETHHDDSALDAAEREEMERCGELSCLTVPLVYGDELVGLVELVDKLAARRFTATETQIAETLAVPAAVAIQAARTRRLEADQRRFLSSLVNASRAFTQTVVLQDVLDRVAREAAEALAASQAAIYEYDEEEQSIVYRALCEREKAAAPEDCLGTAYSLEDYPGERLILMSDGIVLEKLSDPDLPNDRRGCMELWGERSVLSVPLRFHDRRLGILRIYAFDRERTFTSQERQLAAGLGELASAAIHNSRAYRSQEDRTRQLASVSWRARPPRRSARSSA